MYSSYSPPPVEQRKLLRKVMSRDVSTPQRCSNIFKKGPIDDRYSMWE
jgi:hypothetical protein